MKNKTKISFSIFAVAIGSILFSEYSSTADGFAGGAPAGYCGDPANGSKTCANPGCHTGATVTLATGWITTNIPVSGYLPDSTYTITATATRSGHSKFGFEISPQNLAGTLMGTLVNTGTTTQIVTPSSNKYITHTSTGTTGTSGFHTWTFDWVAPAASSGDVTFYGAFNAAGGATNASGDSIFTSTTLVSENVASGIDDIENIANAISIYPNPVSDKFIVSNSLNAAGSLTISISDIRGVLVKQVQNAVAYQTIDIADLADGVYFLRIETSEGEVVKKIVKE